jgi:hypothetical protein
MTVLRTTIFGKIKYKPNTFIGGVSTTIYTPALLATKLGISTSRIKVFKIVGSDIEFAIISGNYSIGTLAFFDNIDGITFYRDKSSLISTVGDRAFFQESKIVNYMSELILKGVIFILRKAFESYFSGYIRLRFVEIDNCISIGNEAFKGLTYLDIFYAPNCTNLGTSSNNNDVFKSSKAAGSVYYFNPYLATNRAGATDGDVADLISRGADVRFVANFSLPNYITDLNADLITSISVSITFSIPTSTNAIDYYEVWLNGIYFQKLVSNTVTGLTAGTFYKIELKAVDIFYNKSALSNSITITTL